ncbi:MAG TPA: RidA family protein [Marmoricola sp.]|nr:RidA family protein [Marmoricola sp.]
MRQTISTDAAPAPVAAYAQGSRIGSVLAVAGQVGMDPATGAVADGVAAQTEQALRNVRSVLQAAGCDLEDVVRMDCYLTSQEHFAPFNEVYARWFPGDAPARATVVVGLADGLDVEIVALAVTE